MITQRFTVRSVVYSPSILSKGTSRRNLSTSSFYAYTGGDNIFSLLREDSQMSTVRVLTLISMEKLTAVKQQMENRYL